MNEKNDPVQNKVYLTIDGHEVAVPKGTTVYHATRELGIDVPIFCYHDRMPPFGACRVCLVEVEKFPKLQASCTLEAAEGMIVKTQSDKAIKGREGILELLLINHPLDCPICDRGGECPLQDNAYHHGPGESRFFEEKRHFKKPLPLGPVLMLDRERCIVCARCTRFGEVVAGDHALEFIDRGYKTEVGTPDGGPPQSKFIGNTIMICPVGALTSRVYRFRARPWDNDTASTTCTHCPIGCSMFLDSRDGDIMRTRSCTNPEVNDIWLCDKGWFGYEFTEHEDRLHTPLVRKNGKLEPVQWEEAISVVAAKILQAKPRHKIAGLGGNPLTIEENYLFQKLIRQAAGANHVDHRVGMPVFNTDEETVPPGMESSLGECDKLSFAILLGLDVTEEYPLLWLRLKQAINHGAQIRYFGHYAPEIARFLESTALHLPGEELEVLRQSLPQIEVPQGKKGAIFVGRQYLYSPHRKEILAELIRFCRSKEMTLNIMEGRGNSMGARIAGMHPDYGPLGEKLPTKGLNVTQVLDAASKTGWDLLYIAGANPVTKYPSKLWTEVRRNLGFLVVQDLFLTETAKQADVVLPTLSSFEKKGTMLNIEGRVQRINPGKKISKDLLTDGEIFCMLSNKLNYPLEIDAYFLEAFRKERLQSSHRREDVELAHREKLPRNPDTLLATFAPSLFDNGIRMNHNPHLSQLAKGAWLRINPEEGLSRGIQNDKTVELSANGRSIDAKIKLDPTVGLGTIVIPLGFSKIAVNELGVNVLNGLEVSLKQYS